ncbi:hypothetical protein HYALB_00004839 [Hymenoscyphus albidus]|uniref:Nucleoside phosphorylase domain-containing protein n=1 Tax=Hymenoscyphus albidus TaxID=595503 RepID=A0A9N9QBC5_9HELO|nr:hypothetical protein HYALB_00004839 [Hymenoscyphus albidus]
MTLSEMALTTDGKEYIKPLPHLSLQTFPTPSDYPVAWICTLTVEFEAATEMLDEKHGSFKGDSVDPNVYALGRIGQHNIVIVCLAKGWVSIASATSTVAHMLHTFRHLKLGLLVGVGGGAPSTASDIRLGDVVSPGRGEDLLYVADYPHKIGEETCRNCDGTRLVKREEWPVDNVKVNYGTIGSGDVVVKDGVVWDEISKSCDGILCFEMEAAGVMHIFPSLVIRGICDYSDSHKNDTWQHYAAATAAAFAKDILQNISSGM